MFGAGCAATDTLDDSHILMQYNQFVFIEDDPKTSKVNLFGGVRDDDLISLEQFDDLYCHTDSTVMSAIITPINAKYKQKIYKLFPDLDYIDCLSSKAHIQTVNTGKGFDARAFAYAHSTISIGNFVKLNYHCFIGNGSTIGDYSFVSVGASMLGSSKLGNGSMLYANATILSGVTVGDNTAIGAGSVVTKDIGDNVVAYGSPCKVVRDNCI